MNLCVVTLFYQKTANLFFYSVFNLSNLLYLIEVKRFAKFAYQNKKITLNDLHHVAQKNNIGILDYPNPHFEATTIRDEDGDYVIAIDLARITSEVEIKHKLAHELGHCMTGSVYVKDVTYEDRKWCEEEAEKWAIRALIPRWQLTRAIRKHKEIVYTPSESITICHFGEKLIAKHLEYTRKTLTWLRVPPHIIDIYIASHSIWTRMFFERFVLFKHAFIKFISRYGASLVMQAEMLHIPKRLVEKVIIQNGIPFGKLAELFDVPEQLVKEALEIYR